jgi:hypothetical protein
MASKKELEEKAIQLKNVVDNIKKEVLYISKEIDVLADDYCDIAGHSKAHDLASRLRKLVGYDGYISMV